MPGGRGEGRTLKEQTVIVDVADNRSVKASDVIKSIEEKVGEGAVVACVPKSGNLYEVTFNDNDAQTLVCEMGFQVGDTKYKPSAIFSRERVVSFLNVSHYVPDSEIVTKLEEFGAELITDIKRKTYPGTQIADGTRYVVIRFPPDRHSLPYTMRLPTGVNSYEYVRVLHDNQKKVCTKCFESTHLYSECPDNMCYKCKKGGHLARACTTPPCAVCNKPLAYCKCRFTWGYDSTRPKKQNDNEQNNQDENVNDDKMEEENQEENDEEHGDDDDIAEEHDVNDNEDDDDDTDNTVINADVHDAPTEESVVDVREDEGNHDTVVKMNDNDNNQVTEQDDNLDLMDDDHSSVDETKTDNSYVDNKNKNNGGSCLGEGVDITDEELAFSVAKTRRRRLVNGPNLSKDDVKRLKSARHPLHSSS